MGRAVLGLVMAVALLTGLATAAGADPDQSELPLVKIVATGGTIANTPDGRLSVESVLENIPEVGAHARIEVEDLMRVGSSSITLDDEITIATAVNRILAEEPHVDGLVITHGSNTSEETAYLLNLVVDSDKPVVITAAQRQQTTLSEDGSRNLLDAVRVAATPEAAGKGVMLSVNQEIHAARDVTKTLGSGRVEAWESGDAGVLGLVDTDRIVFYRDPLTRGTSESEFDLQNVDTAEDLPRVDIVPSYLDADGFVIDALVQQAGADGIVLAGFLTGSPTPAQRASAQAAMEAGVAVVMSTRGTDGRVSVRSEEGEFVGADNLSPQKARILLMLALLKTDDATELQRIFNSY